MDTMTSPPISNASAQETICKLCNRQVSKYTCPACNVAYCSMTCFRSESHSICSETFYRREINADIRMQPSKSAAERFKTLELLKKFEEYNKEEDESLSEGEEYTDDGANLAKRFNKIDLESASVDAVWSMLTDSERAKFSGVFTNPSGALARTLLASEALEREMQEPWWEVPPFEDNHISSTMHHRTKLKPVPIPANMIGAVPIEHCLIYNIVAVCVTYVYATRHLSISPLSLLTPDEPEYEEVQRIISQLIPCLADRGSKILYLSLSDVVTDVWSRSDNMTAQFFSLLLRDTARLLRPAPVTVLPSNPASDNATSAAYIDECVLKLHASCVAVLALSDLSKVVETQKKKGTGQNYMTRKLTFYAAQILSMPKQALVSISDELLARSYEVTS